MCASRLLLSTSTIMHLAKCQEPKCYSNLIDFQRNSTKVCFWRHKCLGVDQGFRYLLLCCGFCNVRQLSPSVRTGLSESSVSTVHGTSANPCRGLTRHTSQVSHLWLQQLLLLLTKSAPMTLEECGILRDVNPGGRPQYFASGGNPLFGPPNNQAATGHKVPNALIFQSKNLPDMLTMLTMTAGLYFYMHACQSVMKDAFLFKLP